MPPATPVPAAPDTGPTSAATVAFAARHILEHGRVSCENDTVRSRFEVQSTSVLSDCALSYQYTGAFIIDDDEGWDTESYSCEFHFENPVAAISVVEVSSGGTNCGSGVRVSITWAGAGVSCGSDGVQRVSLIAMDSREQADRLVNALSHLSSLCVAARPPDPF